MDKVNTGISGFAKGRYLAFLPLVLLVFSALISGCAQVEKPPVYVRVELSNKDILSGKLKDMVKKKLRIDSEFAGLVGIDWKGVVGIETDNKSRIELKDGNIIYGHFVKAPPAKAKIVSDTANSSDISIYDIVAINAPDVAWKGKVTLKFSRFRGNTNTDQFGAKLKGSRESKKDKTSVKGSYDYSETEGEITSKKGDMKIKYDYKFTGKWFGFTAAATEYDRIAMLNQRNKLGLGLGLKAIENAEGKLVFEVGAQFTNEDFENQVPDLDDRYSEGTFAVEYMRKLTPDFKFNALLELSVPFKVYDDWRANVETSVDYKLSKMIALEVGFILKSDQGPPPGVKRTDKEVYAGLNIEF
ncbi:MAG: DUF481 domain-containing protein [Planctomycetota bacterium]|jgi:putative salt-induced outer membrane protein YdiY